jgi:arginyl-tRNA synthetase
MLASGAAYRADDDSIRFRMEGTGDEEDRVVVRGNGVPTYFASDIAYHLEKADRGYQRLINIWGADHHGYVPRMKASLAAFGRDPELLEVLLVQMVTLTRGGIPVHMSKRTGNLVTLGEVIEEVGRDAVRFLFLLRRSDAQMEFDLDLARSQSMENPVYYVQYGHARVAAILRKAAATGHGIPPWSPGLAEGLTLPEEAAMVRDLCRLPAVLASSARRREPHHVAFYLVELVKSFHSYYTRYKHTEKVISADPRKTEARLFLVSCLKAVLHRGLSLLGVSAPEEMHYEVEDEPA